MMIGQMLEQKPADFDELVKMLSEMGCEVIRRRKAICLKTPEWKNIARKDERFGIGYSETEIRAVPAGKSSKHPTKNPPSAQSFPRLICW